MNENIDLTKILEGCPEGTKFYSSIFGEVTFIRLYPKAKCSIELKVYSKDTDSTVTFSYCSDGRNNYVFDGECTLFPSKYQRDWSKFERFWDKSEVKKFNVNTFQPFDKVLVRDFLSDNWMADFFEKIEENDVHYNVTCITTKWIQCIPYNEETKHLIGTKDDCPEYYKWWKY